MLKHLNEENFEKEVINSKDLILVDFFATWCGPCRMLSPVLERIATSRAEFDIAKVDVDQAQNLAYKYDVQVVPTMIIFKDGKIMNRMEGFLSESEIIEEMSKYMEG